MLHMKSVSLRQIQHHLSEVLRLVDHGEEVVVTRRNRPIARLMPLQPAPVHLEWPNFAARALSLKGRGLSQTVLDERDEE